MGGGYRFAWVDVARGMLAAWGRCRVNRWPFAWPFGTGPGHSQPGRGCSNGEKCPGFPMPFLRNGMGRIAIGKCWPGMHAARFVSTEKHDQHARPGQCGQLACMPCTMVACLIVRPVCWPMLARYIPDRWPVLHGWHVWPGHGRHKTRTPARSGPCIGNGCIVAGEWLPCLHCNL